MVVGDDSESNVLNLIENVVWVSYPYKFVYELDGVKLCINLPHSNKI